MDDLKMLRDLGRDLEHEPPASLVRQRQRLADAASGRRGALRRPGGWTLLGVVAVVTAALILVPTVLLRGSERAPAGTQKIGKTAHRTLNLLVLGSDKRGFGAPRTDTMLLVHLPADRRNAKVVSLPRDLMVPIPACKKGGQVIPARASALLNSAYTLGGVQCAIKTVESVTGIRIDQTLTIDFGGFKDMVDALGGVEVTLPQSVNDSKSGLRLSAGRHFVKGKVALAYVRARHGLGDGSDLDRVKRQQRFLAALSRRARGQVFKDPAGVAAFARVAARSIDAVPRLGLTEYQDLARSLEHTDPGEVDYSTVPCGPSPKDPNRLALTPEAAEVFARFR
ncbi:LCP family protein [Actinomadura macrotermitis]|uniref:Transcriptional regulator LytR n=1 Tax=Actinomadura macrotermitis TaxID=2585200 RepID=A0A7K0C1D9_9ACTN|nr:LCP family protein [Actinomadura macrotermitis]MQY06892.1 Transcriptional regulator LytR [Actinomadura macrotermitis]